jgi:hypothetical protein
LTAYEGSTVDAKCVHVSPTGEKTLKVTPATGSATKAAIKIAPNATGQCANRSNRWIPFQNCSLA